MLQEKDRRILRYVPEGKKSIIQSCWKDSDGYWIMLVEGYTAERTDRHCRTIHEDTIKDLRYQIAGIVKDPDYWEDLKVNKDNAEQSVMYDSVKIPGTLVEIVDNKKFTSVLHVVNPTDDKEYIVAIGTTLTDDMIDWRVAYSVNSLEEAEKRSNNINGARLVKYYQEVLETCGDCISASYSDDFHYNLNAAYNSACLNYDPEDISTALALYVCSKAWDGRLTDTNKNWAKDKLEGTDEADIIEKFGSDFTHPVIAIDFINISRKNEEEQLTIKFSEKNDNAETDTERLKRLIDEWSEAEFEHPADFSDPSKVDIAYTTDPDVPTCEIQVSADIEKLRIYKTYAGHLISETSYENAYDMGDVFLSIEFDEITAISDKEREFIIEHYPETQTDGLKIIKDDEIEGLTFRFWDDGSGSAEYNGQTIGSVSYLSNEYRIGKGEWDVLSTGAPDDDTVDFKEACRKYCEYTFGITRNPISDVLKTIYKGRK